MHTNHRCGSMLTGDPSASKSSLVNSRSRSPWGRAFQAWGYSSFSDSWRYLSSRSRSRKGGRRNRRLPRMFPSAAETRLPAERRAPSRSNARPCRQREISHVLRAVLKVCGVENRYCPGIPDGTFPRPCASFWRKAPPDLPASSRASRTRGHGGIPWRRRIHDSPSWSKRFPKGVKRSPRPRKAATRTARPQRSSAPK